MFGRSLFHVLVERHGYHVAEGPQRLLLETIRVDEAMMKGTMETSHPLEDGTPLLYPDNTLERAFHLFEQHNLEAAQVVDRSDPTKVVGYITHTHALEVFNKALIEANLEEHR
jgi:predicted transcriptional regulator